MAPGAEMEKTPLTMPRAASPADRLRTAWTRMRVRWAGMKPVQRVAAVLAAVLLVATTAWLLWYALKPDWRTLYGNLEADDARQIANVLTQAQIPFELSPDGSAIRVRAQYLDKARLAASAKGNLKSGRLGFELFDKPNWVGSEFDEQVNYQRALEGELEHTVGSLADVSAARVHLVMPHDSLFRDQERPAKASVVLKLRRRTLAEGEPEQIRNLVASAVDGLTPDRVALIDADGHLPLGPKTLAAEHLSAEQALEEKLIATLEPVTGSGNVRASVTLDYDPAATEETQERYDPEQTVTLSMQRSEQTTGPQQVAAGVPGTASNAPNSQALPVYPQQYTPPQSARTESGTYGTSKTVRHMIENPGRVRRLTAAIVVNDRLLQPAAPGRAAQWQPRAADEIRNLTMLAQAAVGFDPARGDMLTVEDLSFDENRRQPPMTMLNQWLTLLENSPVLVRYGAFLLGLLLLLFLGIRPAIKTARTTPKVVLAKSAKELKAGKDAKALKGAGKEGAPGTPEQLAAGKEGEAASPKEPRVSLLQKKEEEELDPERIRAQEIFEAVTTTMKREPTQSSRLLQSWIHSE